MPFCPNDRTEYRAGFTVCADCGAQLVDQLPGEQPFATPTTNGEPGDKEFVAGETIGSYDRMQLPIIEQLFEDNGIMLVTRDPTRLGGYLANESSKWATVVVPADRADDARRLLQEELPTRLKEIVDRAQSEPAFAESDAPVIDRDVGPLIPFGWLEPGVARVFMEVMNEEDIACEPEYSLDEPPPPYAREDGRVRFHVEEWFFAAAGNLLENRVRELLGHRWIPFKEPLRGEDP